MNGYKFYLEYPSTKDKRQGTRKQLGNHEGNCIAVIDNWYRIKDNEIFVSGFTAELLVKNSFAVGEQLIHEGYLKTRCKRISEKQAREIHPNLFNSL
jgi:hypothetical protein